MTFLILAALVVAVLVVGALLLDAHPEWWTLEDDE